MTEIDRNALDAQTGGDAQLGEEVLRLFAGECRRLLPALCDAAAAVVLRGDIAHTIRGAAAGVGATRVHALAGRAEAALRSGAPDRAQAVADLGKAIEAALAEIGEGA